MSATLLETSASEPTHLECSLYRGRIRSQERATVRVVNAVKAIPHSRSAWGEVRGREPHDVTFVSGRRLWIRRWWELGCQGDRWRTVVGWVGSESWALGRTNPRLELTRDRVAGIGSRKTVAIGTIRAIRVVLNRTVWVSATVPGTIHIVRVGCWTVSDRDVA